MADIAVIFHWP
ncbi:GpE family phage tail protein, partial [Escherichia coli]|nr:GpE family phage tail protein [Escherichia coli]EKP2299354.1 GpE family phage tail protein [Escherichia coli]ELC2267642.1 GpE family phage tail protein [Escherichia coli]ELF4813518.1 GpE family phage tail protein [Escherichia coli]MBJ5256844.1 GpE family phage tail protein [Salmonella enterica subsp. enterica serovar Mbandaka]